MSDTFAWPSVTAVEAAFAEFDAHLDKLGDLIRLHDKEDPRRNVLLAESLALLDLRERMRARLIRPAEAQVQREVGETTGAWRRGAGAMPRNRGPV